MIDGDEHFRTVCDYVENNPVTASLCDRAEEWPWSSAPIRNVRSLR